MGARGDDEAAGGSGSPLDGGPLRDFSDLSSWSRDAPPAAGAAPPPPVAAPPSRPAAAPTAPPARWSPPGLRLALVVTIALAGAGVVLVAGSASEGGDVVEVEAFPTTVAVPLSDGAVSSVPEAPVPAAPAPDLLSDPAPARAALVSLSDSLELVRLVVYPGYAIASVRAPQDPSAIDRYTYFVDGRGLTGPDPERFAEPDEVSMPVGTVPWDRFPELVAATAGAFADLPGVEVGYLIVDLAPDGSPGVSGYASHPERGGGGYVRFALDGTVQRVVR